MSSRRYAAAGWLAIAEAVLLFPAVGFALFLDWAARAFPGSLTLAALLQLLVVAIGIYVLVTFRALLHELDDFHAADSPITLLVWINVASAGVGCLGLAIESLSLPSSWKLVPTVLAGVLLLFQGIVSIVLGRRLLTMKDDLCGLRKPFAHATVASGVLVLTLVGAPFGLALALAALVLQGVIFLRASDELQYV